MKVAAFDYALPRERIAQLPVEPRDAARMFVHARAANASEHARVSELDRILAPGDLLVVNDTRVLAARLFGRRASGGAVELTLLERTPDGLWRALVRPAAKLEPGERLELEHGALVAHMRERRRGPDGELEPEWRLELESREGELEAALERHGHMPLPPYVQRARGEDARGALDRERYQTVFARVPGAVAAPTAGLHFTPELFERLAARGVERASVTLHVGEGTFRPVAAEDTERHVMHAERYELSHACVQAVERCRARGGRVVAVGTTSVRVLESCAGEDGALRPGAGETRLFLEPGSRFSVVDALLTNFHLPRSTLLMLVCAFAGRERTLELYAEAIAREYRFYSYGDAMLLLP